ncbi:hypothetical protein AALA17_03005 [Lactobacillaceae bacterium 24-114]
MLLLEVAKKLRQPGEVIGIDIRQSADQSNNLQTAIQHNIDLAGPTDVSEVKTSDVTKLLFVN